MAYEQFYDKILIGAIVSGDCVWDIGANVGYYTLKFERQAGASGTVIAFEPSPINFVRLRQSVGKKRNVILRPEALGAERGEFSLVQGTDKLGATSRVVFVGNSTDQVQVPVARADGLVAEGKVPSPSVVKIDTEGSELEVVNGLGNLLFSPKLHTIGIEVHFGILAERRQADALAQIERRLKSAGFTLRWVDASHLIGKRLAREK